MLQYLKASLFDESDYRSAMRRVGVAAIIVGIADIVVMIVAVSHRQSYSTGLNVFAVIAGVALIRGNLGTCLKVARWIGFVGGAAACASWLSLRVPPDLVEVLIRTGRLNPLQIAESVAMTLLFGSMMVWGYRTLTSPHVLDAIRSGGVDCDAFVRRPSTSVLGGIALGVLLIAVFYAYVIPLMQTPAFALARRQVGSSYKLYLDAFKCSNGRCSATVIAYTANDVRVLEESWVSGA